MKYRCFWSETDGLMIKYHDEEWGVPLHNDQKIFEFLVLDAFQAGLSWRTILHKRENFRKAFFDFKADIIAQFNMADYKRLLNDVGIIRNQAKIKATINNAHKFLAVQKDFGSFEKYIWSFVDNRPIVNNYKKLEEFPTKNELSDQISKDLLKKGFKFVGTTITYSFLEASGLLNNHFYKCFRFEEVGAANRL